MKKSVLLLLAILASSVVNAGQLSPTVQMAINPALNATLRPAPPYGATLSQGEQEHGSERITRGGGGMPVVDMAAFVEMKKRAAQVEAGDLKSEQEN